MQEGWNLKPFLHFLCLRSSFQHDHVFHVLRMWEHVHGAYSHDFVLRIQQSQVTRLCGRIATDVDDAMRCGKQDGLYDVFVHAGSWRVRDDYVRLAVCRDEFLVQDVLHVTGEKQGIADSVDL